MQVTQLELVSSGHSHERNMVSLPGN